LWFIWFFHRVGLFQPNKRGKSNKPNNGLLTLASYFYNLLKRGTEYSDIHTVTGMDLTTEYQGSPFF